MGIFDEAFKSRIQLNLRYKNLNESQRLQIWTNFLVRLEKLEQDKLRAKELGETSQDGFGIDATEIRRRLGDLAAVEFNGREIRNTISTARQLAMYRGEPLRYSHLEAVIEQAMDFNDYLVDLHEGFSSNEIQKDKKER